MDEMESELEKDLLKEGKTANLQTIVDEKEK